MLEGLRMAPTESIIDVWSEYTNSDTINLDILLPNGIFLTMDASREATLHEIKTEVFESAKHLPMFSLLQEPEIYTFVVISSITGEREDQNEEGRRLSDVRPFQAVLRLVERTEDRKAEKALDARLRNLLGKGLHEFKTQAETDPEVQDFRQRMRKYCENVARQSATQSWQQRLLREHPVELDSDPQLPSYLNQKLHDGQLVLSIRLEHSDSESTFKFSVRPTINATELLEIMLNKKSHIPGLENGDLNSFLFKICGLEEYVVGPYPLSQYKYIREMISCEKIPELLLVSVDTVQLDEETEVACLDRPRCSSSSYDLLQAKKIPIQEMTSSWTIEDPFTVYVHNIHGLNCENRTKVVVKLALFHGDELLCKEMTTSEQSLEEGGCKWDEKVVFDISVSNIPRATKLCVCVCELNRSLRTSRSRKCPENKQEVYINPISWANTMIFDFKSVLRSDPVNLCLWHYSDDIDVDIMHNPLGGVVGNPEDQAAVLLLSLGQYVPESLVYPSLNEILHYAKAHQYEICDMSATAGLQPQGSKSHLEQLRQICEKDFLYQLHEQEKELMWFLRGDCLHHLPQSSLPKLLRCVKWNEKKEVAEMISLLQSWPLISAVKALELLDYAYADPFVRKFAVACLKGLGDEDLSLYLLQLVRALKHEPYLYCDLLEFLLKRAILHRHIGHKFFWLLRSEMTFPEVSFRFGLILEAYCCGAPEHVPSLTKQVEALRKLKTASEIAHTDTNRRKENREKLRYLVQDLLNRNHYQSAFIGLQNPLDPRFKLGKLRVEKCRVLDSKMKPLWLVFENSDSYGKDVFIIFKNGDDLRQDMLTLQMIRIMDRMWKDEGLDFRMIPYHCLATDHKVGLIEVVPEAATIANIQKEKGYTATSAFKKGSILAWLKDHNPDEKSLNKAAEEFTLSCAGYCVATYVLGIADRHSDNIMLKTNGQLFHIDFGHILGKFKEKFGIKRERVPFVLTHDFVYIITKGHTQKSQEFNRFQQYCEQAFTILRRKGPIMISLFAMMLSTGIPELSSEKDLDYLRETLVLDMTEQEAIRHFRSKFDDALRSSWKTSVNWMAHNWAKDNKTVD